VNNSTITTIHKEKEEEKNDIGADESVLVVEYTVMGMQAFVFNSLLPIG
jgi:predicted 3-demethylubiquinone-9 3-methyltransferase (glyoxalase superfamily)